MRLNDWVLPIVLGGLLLLIPRTAVVGDSAQHRVACSQNVGSPETDSGDHQISHLITTPLNAGKNGLASNPDFDTASDCQISKTLSTTAVVYRSMPISFTIRITNTGDTWIRVLPMQDVYSTTYLTYGYTDTFGIATYASVDSDDHNDDGIIDWSDLTVSFGQDLAPGASFTVVVTFTTEEDTMLLPPDGKTENTAVVHDAWADPDGDGPLGPELPVPSRQDSDRVRIEAYLAVVLESLQAIVQPDGVLITWETANELQTIGFNLLRREAGGELQVVNGEFIFAAYAGTTRGASYVYPDEGMVSGTTYDYVLEVVKSDGSVEPYSFPTVTALWWLHLPLLSVTGF